MRNRRLLSGVAFLAIALLIAGCKKDSGDPSIKFVAGPGFTGKDTTMLVGAALPVTVQVIWNGTDVLDSLTIWQGDRLAGYADMSGETQTRTLTLGKGGDQQEVWKFEVRDIAGNRSSVSLTLTRDPNSIYGSITYYSSVTLGGQSNTAKAGFIGFQTNPAIIYTLEGAFADQGKIDLLYYFTTASKATLASPGSDLPDELYPGARSFSKWTIRNQSAFLKTNLTLSQFSNMTIDKPIIDGWNQSMSFLKAEDLKVNDVWLVKFKSGKKAAILVRSISADDKGEIELGVKVQQ